MIKLYPDEWLLIVDFDLDSSRRISNGKVERHSKDKNEVYKGRIQKKGDFSPERE